MCIIKKIIYKSTLKIYTKNANQLVLMTPGIQDDYSILGTWFSIYSFTIIDNVNKMFTRIAFFANLAFMI